MALVLRCGGHLQFADETSCAKCRKMLDSLHKDKTTKGEPVLDYQILGIDFDQYGLEVFTFDAYFYFPWWLLAATAAAVVARRVIKRRRAEVIA